MSLPKELLQQFSVRVLAGHDRAHRDLNWAVSARTGYAIWHFVDGRVHALEETDRVPAGNLAQDRCYFTYPGDGVTLKPTPGGHMRYILFTMRHGPLKLSERQALSCKDGRQPPPEEFLGFDLPCLIPEALQASCRLMVRRVCDLWWRDTMSHLRANSMLERWLLDFLQHGLDPVDQDELQDSDVWLINLEKLAHMYLARGIRVDELAQLVGLNSAQLDRRIRGMHRIGAGEFLQQCRDREVQRLLDQGELGIAEVGQQVGFDRAQNFSRWFKKRFGITPSQYRQEKLQ